MAPLTSVRQFVISDPPIIPYQEHIKHNHGQPSVVWQQQMEKARTITHNNTHLYQKPMPQWDPDYTTQYQTNFRPLDTIENYNPYYPDPQYGCDPYWDQTLYDQHQLQFRHVLIEIQKYLETESENPPYTHNKKTRALIDLWQMNDGTQKPIFPRLISDTLDEITDSASTPSEDNLTTDQQIEKELQKEPQNLPLLDENQFINVLVETDGDPPYIPLSTSLNLKCKRRMLYFPMDSGELSIDGLIDTGAYSSALPEADLRKIRLLAPQSVIREGPASNFQIMVANGQLETLRAPSN